MLGFGAAFLGHAPDAVVEAITAVAGAGFAPGAPHAAEAELAERVIACVPGAEMVAPMTTGSEAVHAAVRLARAATGRRAIVKFAGHYHGWLDPVFVAGPGSPVVRGAAGGRRARHARRERRRLGDRVPVRRRGRRSSARSRSPSPPC